VAETLLNAIKKKLLLLPGVSWKAQGHFIEISLNLRKVFLELRLRNALYYFLNTFENNFFITIKGAPFCFLPEAQDHVCYEARPSETYVRLPICHRCAVIKRCPGMIKGSKSAASMVRPVFDVPSDVAIEVNARCNLDCRFCARKATASGHEVSLNRIKVVLKQARRLGVRSVRFTGGEPLLRKDIFKMTALARELGFVVFLNTNATLLTQKAVGLLEACVDNVLVSLCGYDARSEEALNAKGSFFSEKCSRLLWLRRSKIPHVRCGTVISKLLIARFDRYVRLVKAMGITQWELYRPMVGDSGSPLYILDKKDYSRLFGRMALARSYGLETTIANAFPFCRAPLARRTALRGAQFDDGHSRIVLDARGYFKPSYFIDENLGEDLLCALRHPLMRRLRSYGDLKGPCQGCRYLRWCLGGSRFMAHARHGDYLAPDPLLRPKGVHER
jgi:MoaA/NifB/PqqE/SkfB family radical SAM enzyme